MLQKIKKAFTLVPPTELNLDDFRPVSLDEEWQALREMIYETDEYNEADFVDDDLESECDPMDILVDELEADTDEHTYGEEFAFLL